MAPWTKHVDLFAHDLIAVPVHANGNHWCLVWIDFRQRTIQLFDSLRETRTVRVLEQMKQYLIDEMLSKRKAAFDAQDWRLEAMTTGVPQQENTSDCGVFCCAFVEALSRGVPIRFTQQDIPWIRQKIVLEICTGKILT